MTAATQQTRTREAINRRNAKRRNQYAAKVSERQRERQTAAHAIDWDAAIARLHTMLDDLDAKYGADR